MSIAIFFFTMVMAFIVYKLISKEQYSAKEKPSWKKLIYWGTLLFISGIFNMLMYTENSSPYRLSTHLDKETLDLAVFLIVSCLIIQIISPSIFFKRINGGIKAIFKKVKLRKLKKKNIDNGEKANNMDKLAHKKTDIPIVEKTKFYSDNSRESQEKDFELFLNTLCWLSFSFVIVTKIFFALIAFINGSDAFTAFSDGTLSKYSKVQKQLNYISSIMLLCTLPISFRQILFYLSKLRKSTGPSNLNKERNSVQYERYMLIQKNLDKEHKKL